MSISDRLDEIEARANAATEGPWEWDRHVRGNGHVVIGDGLRRAHLPEDVAGDAENAEFIAYARTDVPRLVAALRAVLDVCDGLEEAAHQVRNAVEAALGEES